jgi:phosphopentomutase
MQLAAHEEHFGLDRLYKCCETAREIMRGKHNIGRIIARPFTGSEGSFIRTPNRRDYSVEPASDTLLDIMKRSAFDVIGVGKIEDIFAGRGLTASYKTKSNLEGLEVSLKLAKEDFRGLCFVNLVDFDMLYGHRNDIDGYAAAISEFDLWLKGFTDGLNDEDLLIITSDHGCDPGTESTDHSREYTPLLIYNNRLLPKNLKTRKSFADIGKTVAAIYNIDNELDGEVIALEYQ